MNSVKSNQVLLSVYVLSVPLAIHANEGPSTPRKNKRPDSSQEMVTPSPKRRRVMPSAPCIPRGRRSAASSEAASSATRDLSAMLSSGSERMGRTLQFETRCKDVRSSLFTYANRRSSVAGDLFRSNWETLSEDDKRSVVSDRSIYKTSLLHSLVRNGHFELADEVSEYPQDFLKKDLYGKVDADYYPQDRVTSPLLQATARQYYHEHWRKAQRGLK